MIGERYRRIGILVAVWWLWHCGTAACPASAAQRLVTVRDGIEMVELGDPNYLDGEPSCGRTASVSPDRKAFVVVLRSGDTHDDVNRYRMLLWKMNAGNAIGPKTILSMSSSSIWPAIDPSTIVWARDGRSLTFLGEHVGGPHELFQLNIKTGVLRALTTHSTSIMSYSRDENGSTLAYTAIPPFRTLWTAQTARYGFPVTTQYLSDLQDLIVGRRGYYGGRGRPAERQLFVASARGTEEVHPRPGSHFGGDVLGRDGDKYLSVSPDGRYIVVVESVPFRAVPDSWIRYRDPVVHWVLSLVGGLPLPLRDSASLLFERYVLVDVVTGRSRILLDSPFVVPQRAVWAPDSGSIILNNVLLPIGKAMIQRALRVASERRAVEVNILTGALFPISRGCYRAVEWRGDELTCEGNPSYPKAGPDEPMVRRPEKTPDDRGSLDTSCRNGPLREFRRIEGKWRAVGLPQSPGSLQVFVKEDMNSPPEIYLYSKMDGTAHRRLLYDLNPQFRNLKLGKVIALTWDWSTGRKITGGLYYPPNYQQGRRYPLVIQTHGWDEERFQMNGPFPTAFAAQAIAARNIFVLQVQDVDLQQGQLKEVGRAIKIYTSAIRLLSSQGLIDPHEVGIIGFSRTCFYVKWALTHDPSLFAAASVAEGDDAGYLQYITGQAGYAVDASAVYGGGPFGRHLKSWVMTSPGFNLDRVRTPLWINVLNPLSVLLDWEWFEGLRDLGKPVEMVMLDGRSHEEHQLQTPWDRLVSEEGNVDWFDFWLNGHEDSTPSKVAQYARWREFRHR